MKDKPIKQQWPLSAKITVWALGILLAGFAVLYCASLTVPSSGDYITDEGDIHILHELIPASPGPKQSPAKTLREL